LIYKANNAERSYVDGDFDLDLSTIMKLEQASGCQIVRPQLTFYGLCPDCQASGG
jgi:Fe2+ or Zn2+ uptake regulation protein